MSITINGKTEANYLANFIHFAVSAPEPQLERVVVPLRDSFVNLTPMLSSERHYNSRTITIGLELRSFRADWPLYWSQIMEDCHGKEVTIAWSGDPDYYYKGIAQVGALEDHGSTAGVTITVEAQPFKRTVAKEERTTLTIAGTTVYTASCTFMRGYPSFDCSTSGMTVELNGETWTLPSGSSEAYGMFFTKGQNVLTFGGSGTIVLDWEGGSL